MSEARAKSEEELPNLLTSAAVQVEAPKIEPLED